MEFHIRDVLDTMNDNPSPALQCSVAKEEPTLERH